MPKTIHDPVASPAMLAINADPLMKATLSFVLALML
jgi:hypothetical protein